MKKAIRILIVFGVLALLFSLSISPTMAAAPADTSLKELGTSRYNNSFFFNFSPPFVGSICTTSSENEIYSTGNGRVQQEVFTSGIATYGVNYYLFESDSSQTVLATSVTTAYDDISVHQMAYKSGFGNVGEYYKLAGYPATFYFQYFYVEGVWDSSINNPQY